MGLQFIFVVEADKNSKTDFMYIDSAMRHFYPIGTSIYKISPVYMGGKGNYDSKTTIKDISKKQKEYSATSDKNKSVVLYCFDCDKYDTDFQDQKFLETVENYCQINGYKFIWFCRDIEHVFLGKRISSGQKVDEANRFLKKSLIDSVDRNKLSATKYRDRYSNFCNVLDSYFV